MKLTSPTISTRAIPMGLLDLNKAGETSTKAASGYALASTVSQGLCRFLVSALIGRLAGPSTLGTVASTIALAQILALFWPTSLGSAASKFIARARGSGDADLAAGTAKYIYRSGAISVAWISVAAIILSDPVLHRTDASTRLVLISLVLGYSAYSVTRGILYGSSSFRRATLWDGATAAMGLTGSVGLLLLNQRGSIVIAPLAIAYICYGIAGRTISTKTVLPTSLRREIRTFCALGVAGTLASAGFLQAAQLVANATSGATAAGNFSAATTLATPLSLFAAAVSTALFPSFSRLWGAGQTELFKEKVDRAFRQMSSLLPLFFCSAILASGCITRIIWGSRFADAPVLLPLMLASVMFLSVGAVPTVSLTTRSNHGMAVSAGSSAVGMATGLVMWAFLVPPFEALGVAIGFGAGAIVIAGIPIIATWYVNRYSWLSKLVGVLAATVITVAFAEMARDQYLLQVAAVFVFAAIWMYLNRRDLPLTRLHSTLRLRAH